VANDALASVNIDQLLGHCVDGIGSPFSTDPFGAWHTAQKIKLF
jgi:hypothetical protein